MNRLENWFCASAFWRQITQDQLLPWILSGVALGDHLLELGAGPGAATPELRRRVPRLTSLEYSHSFSAALQRQSTSSSSVVQADASALPFRDATFTSAIAILVFHHLPSVARQDRALRELSRVLLPGAPFFLAEIPDGWLHRLIHTRSTFIPVDPCTAPARWAAAGFVDFSLRFRSGGFCVRARRA